MEDARRGLVHSIVQDWRGDDSKLAMPLRGSQ